MNTTYVYCKGWKALHAIAAVLYGTQVEKREVQCKQSLPMVAAVRKDRWTNTGGHQSLNDRVHSKMQYEDFLLKLSLSFIMNHLLK